MKEKKFLCEDCRHLEQLFRHKQTMNCSCFWVKSGNIPDICRYFKPKKHELKLTLSKGELKQSGLILK